jgi:hypothetical protein
MSCFTNGGHYPNEMETEYKILKNRNFMFHN